MVEARLPLPQRTLRVGELTRYLKYLIEQDDLLASLSLSGEISDLSRAPSGHVYFTLKDETSQISCALFRREAQQQAAEVRGLRKGISVVVHGFLTMYEPRGTFQMYVERVLTQGEGAAAQRFEQLRAKLEAEGLFAESRKRPLPPFPRTVALVTSPGSQAYHDVLHRLQAQYPFVTVIEAGASVQGEGAADEMVMALDIVNRLTSADAILLVRGGGAPEELAAFNDERLARAVFASRVPVVTGVGHQTDFTIVDFVADVRAATPSLAAAAVVPDAASLVRRTAELHVQLTGIMRGRLREDRRRWLAANRALIQARPETRLAMHYARASSLRKTAQSAMYSHLRTKRERLESLKLRLESLDPLAVLGRGFTVLSDPHTGNVVRKTGDVRAGQLLKARLADGELNVRVEE